ncbi:MAG: deoxyribonuclease IV [Candidatus Thorarchaeota archaeon]
MSIKNQIKCGLHISIAKGIDLAVDRAKEKTCNTFQIFTSNPRSWRARSLHTNEIIKFNEKLHKYGMKPVFSHIPYLPNFSSPNMVVYKKSVKSLVEELDRCNRLTIPYVVIHLGSHLGKGRKVGLKKITNAIKTAFNSSNGKSTLLLENTSGTKNSMGSSFREIQEIIDQISDNYRLGICFDTCHAFAAGYDLRDTTSIGETIDKLKEEIDLERLKVIHANDSKGKLSSHMDRHEHIGKGHIGNKGFRTILHTDIFRRLPIILETPIDNPRDDLKNLARIRKLSE